jgi:uncharacterized protein (DUF4415 family)
MLGAPVLKRGRGLQAAPTKVLTSVRLDADILEFFKAQGSGYQSRKRVLSRWKTMKAEYDLSKLKSRKNPYASKLKKPVTMRLSEDVVDYFKGMADEAGVPYQSLINLYLRDCLASSRKVQIN